MSLHRNRFHKNTMRWVANSQIKWKIQIDDNEAFTAFGGAVDLDAFCQSHLIELNDTALAVAQTVITAERNLGLSRRG